MVYAPPKRKFTVDEYHLMADVGIFREDDRVELLDGEIYEMTPVGDSHIGRVNGLTYLFIRRLDDRVVVSPQNPIRLSDLSEPQPDLVLLRPRDDFYGTRKATPADVLLLIEIAKTSLDHDRTTKLPQYAKAGIIEVWIVNLADDCLEVYRKPSDGGYGERLILTRGQDVVPLTLSDIVLRVDDILG